MDDGDVATALLVGGVVEPPVPLLDSVDAQADRGEVLEGRSGAG